MKLGVYCANETLSRYFDGVSLANNGIEHKTDSKGDSARDKPGNYYIVPPRWIQHSIQTQRGC